MINRATIETILDTARVEEVVADFVSLKKRGANYLGLCPFHNEKTPSFNVSPSKGIYKCFGCGKGGNAVQFIMEYEHFSFPEALKFLANKYHIEIEEDVNTAPPEDKNKLEALYVALSFSQKYFSELVYHHEEGIAIGLSYLKERGFSDETIKKFQLGYSLNQWSHLMETATGQGYTVDALKESGMLSGSDETSGEKKKLYDRFRARVMFPIHSVAGRVIGFGGRILKKEDGNAKYLNSPQTPVYDKKRVLYGIYFAKNKIISEDNCILVEGYTDVISLHQSGIENVVSSSGTSLTVEQIQLIRRYTHNLTFLYDGDNAGLNAAERGVDMALEEGLNVKIVVLPQGDDPDSFARTRSSIEVREYISKQGKDFVLFKAGLLMKDVERDPFKKAEVIKNIVESLIKIPDPITRNVYIKECSRIMDMREEVLIMETNRQVRKLMKKSEPAIEHIGDAQKIPLQDYQRGSESADTQERDILRLLINYGNKLIHLPVTDEHGVVTYTQYPVDEFIISEIIGEHIAIDNPVFKKILEEYESIYKQEGSDYMRYFTTHEDEDVRNTVIDLLSSPHMVSENWKHSHGITVPREEALLRQAVIGSVHAIKLKQVNKWIAEIQRSMKIATSDEEVMTLMREQQKLDEMKSRLGSVKGTVIF